MPSRLLLREQIGERQRRARVKVPLKFPRFEAKAAVGDKQVHMMGGADLVHQALAAGLVAEFMIIIAPVTLGAGKRLFEGFGESLDLEHGMQQTPFATFGDYRVQGEGGKS